MCFNCKIATNHAPACGLIGVAFFGLSTLLQADTCDCIYVY